MPDWIAFLCFSALLLVPCFWQKRIQSADLSSHIYNAWLANQVHNGKLRGLWISSQSTNVLFDLMLEWLLVRVGADWAQRLAVSFCVLVFGCGAVFFVFRVSGRNWWFAGPTVAMLAYGFIFHMGFFNFYLSLGLCLWYLALSWNRGWRTHLLAALLLIPAWGAHPFPVVWALAISAYATVARRITTERRSWLLLVGLATLVVVRLVLYRQYVCRWYTTQLGQIVGTNQVVLFGYRYLVPFGGLLLLWTVLLRGRIKGAGVKCLISESPFQLLLLQAAAVVVMPGVILFPSFAMPFSYIPERISLFAALIMCAVVAPGLTSRRLRTLQVCVTTAFFGLLYFDNLNLNRAEDRLDSAVSSLPARVRVITRPGSSSLRSLCLYHDLDRACVGHCYSYANYEPSSGQFRIRASPDNGIVLDKSADAEAVADGHYVVQSRDLPLYLIYQCGRDHAGVCSRPLQLGTP